MFDKNNFDRNAYNRSVASEGFNIALTSSSALNLNLVIIMPIEPIVFIGQGKIDTEPIIRSLMNFDLSGNGDLYNEQIILRQSIHGQLTASGSLDPNMTIITPIQAALEGSSDFHDSGIFMYQNIYSSITSVGEINVNAIFKTSIYMDIVGSGSCEFPVTLHLPFSTSIQGSGDMDLRRVGSLDVDIFELLGINLMPGEEVIIDTDLLDVIFGDVHDVNSVTNESEFFELNPGNNEITISTNIADGALKVVAIWQNRWL